MLNVFTLLFLKVKPAYVSCKCYILQENIKICRVLPVQYNYWTVLTYGRSICSDILCWLMNTDIEQIFSQPVKNIHKYGAKTKFLSNPFIQIFSLILTLVIAKVEDKVGIPLCIKDFFKLQAGSQ